MGKPSTWTVTGVDQSEWVIAGPGQAAQGVEMAISPQGMYDTDITSIWNSTAFQDGATFGGFKYNKRDAVFTVNIFGVPGMSWQAVESAWKRAWAYDADSVISITTESGTRSIACRKSQAPLYQPVKDSRLNQLSKMTMTVTAGIPWWTEPDITQPWVSPSDTSAGTSTQYGTIYAENPTDVPMYLEWVCSAPGQWTLPDFSFGKDYYNGLGSGAANMDRVITLPRAGTGQDLTVDTDPSHEMIVSADGSNFWAAMNGVSFLYPVPPFTSSTPFQVAVTYAPAGASVMCVQHRNFSAPWG